ncbi:hypothetical protein, partial [Arthrobacter sp. ISL-28]|uniref:hypothetical protein n=1 Tax=Arthrobacter sp. ISL-28 TaxID=2819108 RepID=UPI001BEA4AC0
MVKARTHGEPDSKLVSVVAVVVVLGLLLTSAWAWLRYQNLQADTQRLESLQPRIELPFPNPNPNPN